MGRDVDPPGGEHVRLCNAARFVSCEEDGRVGGEDGGVEAVLGPEVRGGAQYQPVYEGLMEVVDVCLCDGVGGEVIRATVAKDDVENGRDGVCATGPGVSLCTDAMDVAVGGERGGDGETF